MNIKKEAYDRLLQIIQRQVGDIDRRLKSKRHELSLVVNEISILKMEKSEAIRLRSIVMKDKDDNKRREK